MSVSKLRMRMINFDCGIYSITIPTGQKYIGQTTSFRKRWKNHICNLRAGRNTCSGLQSAFDKHGIDALVFAKLAIVREQELSAREQEQIDAVPAELLLNRRLDISIERCNRGERVSEETRRAYSAAKLGVKLSDQHRARISNANRGVPKSDAWRSAISAAVSGAKNVNARPVLCVELQLTFGSFSDARKWLRDNGHPKAATPNLSLACRGKLKKAYGYTWLYA